MPSSVLRRNGTGGTAVRQGAHNSRLASVSATTRPRATTAANRVAACPHDSWSSLERHPVSGCAMARSIAIRASPMA